MKTLTPKTLATKIYICLAVLLTVMCVCSLIGTYDISFGKVFSGRGETGDNIDFEIFVSVRLPRIILAALVGAALACAGVVLQTILRNPLADPYILGISSGAGLGMVIVVMFGAGASLMGESAITIFAFIGALSTIILVWSIGYFTGESRPANLLLAGVVVNAFFSAVIMFLTSIANSNQLKTTIYWLMGNITEKSWAILAFCLSLVLAAIAALFTLCHKLNVIALGESEAKSLGINTTSTRFLALGLAAFITAIAVSLSGLIGFVGLIVPHAVRLVSGPDNRQLLPISAIIGAIFLVIADTIARTIIAPAQLPVGVITAMIGGPFFLVLLAKYSRKVSWLK